MKIIPFSSGKTTQWAGGSTTEMFIHPAEAKVQQRNFLFRISSANVEVEESEFTFFEGFKRIIASLDKSFELLHQDRWESYLLKPLELHHFDGSWTTKCIGKIRDFNVIFKAEMQVNVSLLQLTKNDILLKESDFHFLFYLGESQLDLEGVKLNQFDLIHLTENLAWLDEPASFFVIEIK